MGEPIAAVLDALTRAGCTPKRHGDAWSARCPAHDDRDPSLSIGIGTDARVLLHCHAGCPAEAIVGTLGLAMRDLMPTPMGETRRLPAQRKSASDATFATSDEAIAVLERKHGAFAARWAYTDAQGVSVGEVVRWNPPAGGKIVRPISCRGDGWVIAAMPEPRPLLNLPELSRLPDGAWVYIVEGETCVDAARAIGLVATTSAGGSNAAGKSDWSVMKGKVAVILPDHDAAGDAYADEVALLCQAAGAQEVRIVRLAENWPAVPPGGDLVDVLAMEGGDAEAVHEKVDALAVAAEPVTPEAPADDKPHERPAFDLADLFPAATVDIRDYFADPVDADAAGHGRPAGHGGRVGVHLQRRVRPRARRSHRARPALGTGALRTGHAQVSGAGGTAAADPEVGSRQGARDAPRHRRGGSAAPHHRATHPLDRRPGGQGGRPVQAGGRRR
jgi:hypothetical protein